MGGKETEWKHLKNHGKFWWVTTDDQEKLLKREKKLLRITGKQIRVIQKGFTKPNNEVSCCG